MKNLLIIPILLSSLFVFSQSDTTKVYKKRVLEDIEINLLSSFYTQDGKNAAVTGGIGSEDLQDFATTINVAIPLNDDDVLTIDATISAYTSASSSNLNPFSGASEGGDDDDPPPSNTGTKYITGTPWLASSGASRQDVWVNGIVGYSHSSDNRNNISSVNVSVANEFDYISFGLGGGFTKLFNQKNTTLSFKGNLYIDAWKPQYPTEIIEYLDLGGDLDAGFFQNVNILDNNGDSIDKNGTNAWKPVTQSKIIDKHRNTFSASLSFSQILNKRTQFSIFTDVVIQEGWLSNPMQRVYFSDKANYFIGNGNSISNYTSPTNTDVFQLADDIEKLPSTRIKTPIGVRLNYYVNEFIVLRIYYRYYFDDWGVKSHTANIEIPLKISQKFTLYPSYRYYTQTAATYFAPFDAHLSTDKFYTSDYDLSMFDANQYGLGIKYTDIFTKAHIWKIRLKTLNLDYSYYSRSTGLKANIITFGAKFIVH